MEDDLRRLLFGLPQRYRDSVRAITPGLPLFLYNYSAHQLHGIFERDKPSMAQLAVVACLSLSAKVEETQVPVLLDWIAVHDRRREAMKRRRSGVAGSFFRNHEMGSQRNLRTVLGKVKDGNFAEDLVLVYRACARAA